ncbi:MAG TPA: MarR family winged helix-turn-helix transcriptional regulator [Pseudonocardiaceae bacterium]|jgi:DNA-binding MarR family transcriptional regulator
MGTGSAAFLLAQVGAYAARMFDERIGSLELTPPQVGLLRAIAMQPGRSQQALAEQLGTPATRLVALLDGLERRGAIERRRNPDDRRLHALHLTEVGQELMRSVGRVAMAHGADLTAALDDSERAQLQRLLLRIAEDKKLAAGVHPGFRSV